MSTATLNSKLRKTYLSGLFGLFIFFGIFGGWATFVPLAQGAMAIGTVSPDGKRRTIQHLEGGIIKKLNVRDGQSVKKGDILMVLEDVQSNAMVHILEGQLWSYLAEYDRLYAELEGHEQIAFSEELLKNIGQVSAQDAMGSQTKIFTSRQQTFHNEQEILEQTIKQIEQQIFGLKEEVISIQDQRRIIKEELENLNTLANKRLVRKARLLELQRTQAQLAGSYARNTADIAKHKEAISEKRLEIIRLSSERYDEVNAQLAELQPKIIEVRNSLYSTRDILERTIIRSPLNGTVINLQFSTIQGVVGAGEDIMDIVPNKEKLIVDAKISPLDIDAVHADLSANVFLSAYPRRTTPTLPARVEWVAADIQKDEATGEEFYSARVIILADQLANLPPDIALYPGMPTEVLIKTGERTAMDYLIDPIVNAMDRSFIEE